MRSVRLWFTKKDSAKYISHLDLTRCLIRAFRRTDIPLWYTEGFNPHPHLVFGLPLPLGAEGLRETLDIRLNDDTYSNERVLEQLNMASVPGIEFLEIAEPIEKPIAIVSAEYSVSIHNIDDAEGFYKKVKSAVSMNNILIQKKTKKGDIKEINVTDHLKSFVCTFDNDCIKMGFVLPAGNDFTINPVAFCNALFDKIGESDILYRVVRLKLMTKSGAEFK